MNRVEALGRRCKNRGGDCPCPAGCQAVDAFNVEIAELQGELACIERQIETRVLAIKRLTTPMAAFRDGFTFELRYEPVMVFDGDEAHFGYEDSDGDWTESEIWPFDQDFVWFDDCERLGIRVE